MSRRTTSLIPKSLPIEFVFQVGSLTVITIVVHLLYVALVRPKAHAFLQALAKQVASTDGYVAVEQNFWVIISGIEQQLAVTFAIWACAIIWYKFRNVGIERQLMDVDLVMVSEGESILPEDARAHARVVEALPEEQRERLLPRLYLAVLRRFRITRSVQDASEEARRVAEAYGDRLDSELAVLRYITWAIPSIGFVGTVRGIGLSLGHAQSVLRGDMTGVTEALGVAFNSTLVALLLSLLTVFLLYQLQRVQERVVLDAHGICERRLIEALQLDR